MQNPSYTVVIIVKYFGPTDHKGSRVRLEVPDLYRKITLPYDYALGSSQKTALKWCHEHKIDVVFTCDGNRNEMIFVVNPFCKKELSLLFGA